jgi:arylsulfatase A-like enzyme
MLIPLLLQNIVLCMTDDQGYADAGFQGHAELQTPQLDRLAASGMVLSHFYAAAPVCSPTRASCLTGLHPNRLGIFHANTGHLPDDALCLAEWLGARGYATGHFGKWHLGTLTRELVDANRGGKPQHDAHYAPPWEHGFEVCFSTESKVPTADPMRHPKSGEAYGTRYWTGPGQVVTENLDGDDSRVIMDRVLPFVRTAAAEQRPFFAVIWFHSPHLPLVTTPELEAPYQGLPNSKYLASLAGVDQQMGRLWEELEALGLAKDTMLWFCSDNGPERMPGDDENGSAESFRAHSLGSAAPFRGRKRTLFEGGIRSPAFVVWPGMVPAGTSASGIAVTSDYFPTLVEALSAAPPVSAEDRPINFDGVSILPMILGQDWQRPTPLGFVSRSRYAWIDWPYKLVCNDGRDDALYDLSVDPGETTDLAQEKAGLAARMRLASFAWRGQLSAPMQ